MEKIRINSIEMKGPAQTICVVKYDNIIDGLLRADGSGKMPEATLNTKWQSQEIDYLVKDVGVGGEVSVEISSNKPNPKGGFYTNIDKVDFGSAVGGGVIYKEVKQGERSVNGQVQKGITEMTAKGASVKAQMGLNDDRSKSIIAQCLVKATMRNKSNVKIEDTVEMYKEALELLSKEGEF